MGVINRVPNGYLKLLQSQSQGKTPPEASDFVQPSLELSDFYNAHLYSTEVIGFTHTAPQQSVSITVPADEVWHLVSCGFQQLSLGVGETVTGQLSVGRLPRVSTTQNAPIYNTGPLGPTSAIALELMAAATVFPKRIALLGGSLVIGTVTERNAASGRACSFSIVVVRYGP